VSDVLRYLVILGDDEDDVFEMTDELTVEEVALSVTHEPSVGVVAITARDNLDELIETARERGLKVGRCRSPEKARDMLLRALGIRTDED
jgi:hypothetical protein